MLNPAYIRTLVHKPENQLNHNRIDTLQKKQKKQPAESCKPNKNQWRGGARAGAREGSDV